MASPQKPKPTRRTHWSRSSLRDSRARSAERTEGHSIGLKPGKVLSCVLMAEPLNRSYLCLGLMSITLSWNDT